MNVRSGADRCPACGSMSLHPGIMTTQCGNCGHVVTLASLMKGLGVPSYARSLSVPDTDPRARTVDLIIEADAPAGTGSGMGYTLVTGTDANGNQQPLSVSVTANPTIYGVGGTDIPLYIPTDIAKANGTPPGGAGHDVSQENRDEHGRFAVTPGSGAQAPLASGALAAPALGFPRPFNGPGGTVWTQLDNTNWEWTDANGDHWHVRRNARMKRFELHPPVSARAPIQFLPDRHTAMTAATGSSAPGPAPAAPTPPPAPAPSAPATPPPAAPPAGPLQWTPVNATNWMALGGWTIRRNSKAPQGQQYSVLQHGRPFTTPFGPATGLPSRQHAMALVQIHLAQQPVAPAPAPPVAPPPAPAPPAAPAAVHSFMGVPFANGQTGALMQQLHAAINLSPRQVSTLMGTSLAGLAAMSPLLLANTFNRTMQGQAAAANIPPANAPQVTAAMLTAAGVAVPAGFVAGATTPAPAPPPAAPVSTPPAPPPPAAPLAWTAQNVRHTATDAQGNRWLIHRKSRGNVHEIVKNGVFVHSIIPAAGATGVLQQAKAWVQSQVAGQPAPTPTPAATVPSPAPPSTPPAAPAPPPAPPAAPAVPAPPATPAVPPPYKEMQFRRNAPGSYSGSGQAGRSYDINLTSGRFVLTTAGTHLGTYRTYRDAKKAADATELRAQNPVQATPSAGPGAHLTPVINHVLGHAIEAALHVDDNLDFITNQSQNNSPQTVRCRKQPSLPRQLYVHASGDLGGSVTVTGRDAAGLPASEDVPCRAEGSFRTQTVFSHVDSITIPAGPRYGGGTVDLWGYATSGDPSGRFLGAMMTELGADQIERTASQAEMDALIDGGAMSMLRGFNDNHGTLDDIHRAFVDGSPMGILGRAGTAYGNGIYYAVQETTGHRRIKEYDVVGNTKPYWRGNNHGLFRQVLSPLAKVVTASDASREMGKHAREARSLLDRELQSRKAALSAQLQGAAPAGPAAPTPPPHLSWSPAPHISANAQAAQGKLGGWSTGFYRGKGQYGLFFDGKPVNAAGQQHRAYFGTEQEARDFAHQLDHRGQQPLPATTGAGVEAWDFGVPHAGQATHPPQSGSGPFANHPQMRALDEWHQRRVDAVQRLCSDNGYWGLAAGYDAVDCEANTMGNSNRSGQTANYYVLLNRRHVIAQDRIMKMGRSGGTADYRHLQKR